MLAIEKGELLFNSMANYFISKNKDVEKFLKEKSVQAAKLKTSSTYIIISDDATISKSGKELLQMYRIV